MEGLVKKLPHGLKLDKVLLKTKNITVADLIECAGMTRQETAKKLGIANSTVTNIIRQNNLSDFFTSFKSRGYVDPEWIMTRSKSRMKTQDLIDRFKGQKVVDIAKQLDVKSDNLAAAIIARNIQENFLWGRKGVPYSDLPREQEESSGEQVKQLAHDCLYCGRKGSVLSYVLVGPDITPVYPPKLCERCKRENTRPLTEEDHQGVAAASVERKQTCKVYKPGDKGFKKLAAQYEKFYNEEQIEELKETGKVEDPVNFTTISRKLVTVSKGFRG